MYPELLLAQAKQIQAADLLFEGCAKEYINALATGRLEAWAKMAHSIVDLLATDAAIAAKDDEIEKLRALNDKFMWQVRDTCVRAEKAEARIAELEASQDEAVRRDAARYRHLCATAPGILCYAGNDFHSKAEFDSAIDAAIAAAKEAK